MELDYSDSRMTDLLWIGEYESKIGKQRLNEFINIVYGWLINLKPGQSLNITTHSKITERNRDLVIKIGCLFISESNYNYEFSNDFTKITNNSYVSGTEKPKANKNMEKTGRKFPV